MIGRNVVSVVIGWILCQPLAGKRGAWFVCSATSGKGFACLSCLRAKTQPLTAIYLTSHSVRIWHKAVLCWEPYTNLDLCTPGEKILEHVGIPLLGRLGYQAINLVMQASKNLCYSMQV